MSITVDHLIERLWNPLDVITIVLIVFVCIQSFLRGFLKELLYILSWIICLVLFLRYLPDVLCFFGATNPIYNNLIAIGVFLLFYATCSFFRYLLESILHTSDFFLNHIIALPLGIFKILIFFVLFDFMLENLSIYQSITGLIEKSYLTRMILNYIPYLLDQLTIPWEDLRVYWNTSNC